MREIRPSIGFTSETEIDGYDESASGRLNLQHYQESAHSPVLELAETGWA